MGLADMLFNGVLAVFALLMIATAVAGWWRTRRRRYLMLGGVCLVVGVGWAMGVLSGRASSTGWLYTLIGLIVCALFLVSFRHSDRAEERSLPLAVEEVNDEEATG
jgi:uncharacterized membrane protein YfcA